jgi:hypothetical protein
MRALISLRSVYETESCLGAILEPITSNNLSQAFVPDPDSRVSAAAVLDYRPGDLLNFREIPLGVAFFAIAHAVGVTRG